MDCYKYCRSLDATVGSQCLPRADLGWAGPVLALQWAVGANQLWATKRTWLIGTLSPRCTCGAPTASRSPRAFEHIRRIHDWISPAWPAYRGGNVLLVTNLLVIQGLCVYCWGYGTGDVCLHLLQICAKSRSREESTPLPFLIGYANAAVLTSLFANSSCNPLRPLSPCQLASEPADRMWRLFTNTFFARRSYVHQLADFIINRGSCFF